MKKIFSMLIFSLAATAFVWIPVQAQPTSAVTQIPLSYFDLESDWTAETDTHVSFPLVYNSFANGLKTLIESDTRQLGGNPADPISAAKAEDDAYLKIKILPTLSIASNTDIVLIFLDAVAHLTNPTPAQNQSNAYELSAMDSVTVSFDVATTRISPLVNKFVMTGRTHRPIGSENNNRWPAFIQFQGNGQILNSPNIKYSNNMWHNIIVQLGGHGVSGENQNYKIYVDGVEAGAGDITSFQTPLLSLLRMGMQVTPAQAGQVDDIFFDNLALYANVPFSEELYKVNRDAADLSLARDMLLDNPSTSAVSSNLYLPTTLPNGSTVTWESNNAAVSNTGVVTPVPSGSIPVTLTATITNGTGTAARTAVKQFKLNVFADLLVEACVDLTFDKFANGQAINNVTHNLGNLPSTGLNETTITWESENPDILSRTGVVNSDKFDGYIMPVVLTATITRGNEIATKDFTITVKKDTSSWAGIDFIDYDFGFLYFNPPASPSSDSIISLTTQDAERIVSSITLPTHIFPDASTITWSVTGANSSSVAQISNNVVSFTPDNDKETDLILVATGHYGSDIKTKEFPIKVIRGFAPNLAVTAGAAVSVSTGTAAAALSTRNFETYWTSANTENSPIPMVTFRFPQNNIPVVSAALFVEKGNIITGYEIQHSPDGDNWTTVYKGTTLGDKKRIPVVFSDIQSRYIRFVVTSPSGADVSLYNAELYNVLHSASRNAELDRKTISIPRILTSSIVLPTKGPNGSTFVWRSSNTDYISNTGVVTRPTGGRVDVILTATITNEDVIITDTYPISISPVLPPAGGGNGGGGTTYILPSVSTLVQKDIIDEVDSSLEQDYSQFKDVDKGYWAYSYINSLYEAGIVSGFGGMFNPNEIITREEFIKLIVLSGGLEILDDAVSFTDVAEGEWYYQYAATAYKNEITKGVENGLFGVGRPISRQDMAVLASRLLQRYGKLPDEVERTNYKDNTDIADYAAEMTAKLAAMGIMNGNDSNEFLPNNSATRAEASKVIYLIMGVIGHR